MSDAYDELDYAPPEDLATVKSLFKSRRDPEDHLLKEVPTQRERNFQLALCRLVSDVDERRLAEFDGARFQKKYALNNEDMIKLGQVAIWCGEVNAKAEWEQIIRDLKTTGIVGSCSCCCP